MDVFWRMLPFLVSLLFLAGLLHAIFVGMSFTIDATHVRVRLAKDVWHQRLDEAHVAFGAKVGLGVLRIEQAAFRLLDRGELECDTRVANLFSGFNRFLPRRRVGGDLGQADGKGQMPRAQPRVAEAVYVVVGPAQPAAQEPEQLVA